MISRKLVVGIVVSVHEYNDLIILLSAGFRNHYTYMSDIKNHSDLDQKRDELIFDLIKRRFDNEWQRIDAPDTRARTLIGFISIVVILTLAAGIFNLKTLTAQAYPQYHFLY